MTRPPHNRYVLIEWRLSLPLAEITGRHTQTYNGCKQAFDDHGQHMIYSAYIMHGMTDLPSWPPIQALFR